MSELVGGKCGRTPAVGSAVPCGSASPVCYLISVLGAARRFACENRREPDLGFRCGSASPGCSIWFPHLGFRCGSASPMCSLISVLGAARRLLFDTGARCSVRLGVFLVGIGLPLDSVYRAARRVQFDIGSQF